MENHEDNRFNFRYYAFFEDKQQKPIPVEVQQPPRQETAMAVETAQETQDQENAEEQGEETVPDLVDDPNHSDDEEEKENEAEPEEQQEETPGIASRTRSQTKKYAMAVKKNKARETDPVRKKAIKEADKAEIKLLFVDLQGLQPVAEQEVAGRQVYNSHMFSVENFLADGTHDKFKSRLVFEGRDQDPELFPDRSSPTTALHSLMVCVAVASASGMTKVGKIDVKGAFIQTEMTGPPLYIRCNKDLTRLIVEALPAIAKYVTKEGILFCRLLKALYGCVQASKLWFDKLTKFLRTQGYEHSPNVLF